MKKLDFKSKKIITILGVMVILLVVVVFFWLNNTSSPLPKSSHFEIVDDQKKILYSQNISELSVTPQAVEVWQAKIKELELAVPNITDEVDKKKYYNDIAMYLAYLGRYQEAYDYYIKSLDISYIDRITWLQFGDLLIKMQAYKSAEVAYIKGNDINPYEQLNYIKLAELYVLMGKSENEIIAVYDKGIGLIESPTAILQAKAYYYEKNKNYTEALKTYEAWLKIADDSNRANIEAGINSLKKKM